MRVGLSYDLLRLSPCSGDLFNRKPRGRFLSRKLASHPPNKPPSKHTTTQEPQKFHLPDRMDRVGIRWTRYFFYYTRTSVNRLKNSPQCSRIQYTCFENFCSRIDRVGIILHASKKTYSPHCSRIDRVGIILHASKNTCFQHLAVYAVELTLTNPQL